jgi:hypothetical protein
MKIKLPITLGVPTNAPEKLRHLFENQIVTLNNIRTADKILEEKKKSVRLTPFFFFLFSMSYITYKKQYTVREALRSKDNNPNHEKNCISITTDPIYHVSSHKLNRKLYHILISFPQQNPNPNLQRLTKKRPITDDNDIAFENGKSPFSPSY